MKWVFYVIVFVYMAYRAVYGAKVGTGITVEKINYSNETFVRVGARRTINCRATSKNQLLEWVDPSGKSIKRLPTNRIYAQEHLVSNPTGGRAPALGLTFTDLQAKDTGIYTCKSGNVAQEVPLCVIQPAEFIDTPTEVVAAVGRSITLTCQAKGDPEPNLVWMRDTEEISDKNDSSKYITNTKYNSQGFESLLTIMSLEPEDSGQYNCVSSQHPELEDCGAVQVFNVSLQVSHGPSFENSDVKAVYGKANDIVDLVCSASGYPAPNYRWFKATVGDTLAEFDKKQIKYSKEENQAVLSVTASPSTFGQTYKCLATNTFGDTEKYFKLYKIQKPEKPDKVKFLASSDSQIELNVTWYDEIVFPVKGFLIQYLKTKRKPKDFEWRKADEVYTEVDDDLYVELSGLKVTVEDLSEDTCYWIRVRPTNDAGDGAWSDATFAKTDIKSEEPEEEEEPDKPVAAEVSSDGAFYGIFFAGGIAIIAVVCMFAMRLV